MGGGGAELAAGSAPVDGGAAVVDAGTVGGSAALVDAEVAALRARGITFEAYETPATDAAGIARIGPGRAAWFKDPAGNLLAVIQFDDLA